MGIDVFFYVIGYVLICFCEDYVKNYLLNNEDIFYYFIVDSLIRLRGKKMKNKGDCR